MVSEVVVLVVSMERSVKEIIFFFFDRMYQAIFKWCLISRITLKNSFLRSFMKILCFWLLFSQPKNFRHQNVTFVLLTHKFVFILFRLPCRARKISRKISALWRLHHLLIRLRNDFFGHSDLLRKRRHHCSVRIHKKTTPNFPPSEHTHIYPKKKHAAMKVCTTLLKPESDYLVRLFITSNITISRTWKNACHASHPRRVNWQEDGWSSKVKRKVANFSGRIRFFKYLIFFFFYILHLTSYILGLYCNHGDFAPLPKIIELKKKYKFRLIMDDSYGIGNVGKTGRGTCEYFNVDVKFLIFIFDFYFYFIFYFLFFVLPLFF